MNDNMERRMATLEERVNGLMEKTNDLEMRLRGVERSVWKSTGALAVFQVILTVILIAVKVWK